MGLILALLCIGNVLHPSLHSQSLLLQRNLLGLAIMAAEQRKLLGKYRRLYYHLKAQIANPNRSSQSSSWAVLPLLAAPTNPH